MSHQPEEGTRTGSDAATASYDPSTDPKRKAKSKDPGWKYAFWPTENKDLVQCTLCGTRVHSGIKRLKQHLIGGFGDCQKCPGTTTAIMREMQAWMQKTKRKPELQLDDEEEDDDDHVLEVDGQSQAEERVASSKSSRPSQSLTPSSGTAAKRKAAAAAFSSKKPAAQAKTIPAMILKPPEEVVRLRHTTGPHQVSLYRTGKSKEERDFACFYIAKFFYENGIPFNATNSRSYEEMVEAIGQYGHGLKPLSYHEMREPFLEKHKETIEDVRRRHELAWKNYGCTLMSDAWSDKRGRHLINFLVNSPEGTFFLESVNASHLAHDAPLLAGLLGKKIEEIGEDKVVQVVTDNGSNYKAAGRLLMEQFPALYWTPCAAHCLDLMLEDIGKLSEFKSFIAKAKRVTTFIYRHGRILDAMRNLTGGRDLVRAAVTRFATSFLTLQSMLRHRDSLRKLFLSDDWSRSKLAKTETGKQVSEIVLSIQFWNAVEDCLRASQPLLIVLRLVDSDEEPAMPELYMAMEMAKKKIKENIPATKQHLCTKVLDIVQNRWEDQMGHKLHGAALFLNPSKFFDILVSDEELAGRARIAFNVVIAKMCHDNEEMLSRIDVLADDYQQSRGTFSGILPKMQRKTKSPLDWWKAYGGEALPLQKIAKRITSLCCSSSGCERNWSTFEFIHTKKRNRLEHKKLNDLVYVQYNTKISTRFQKLKSEGKKFNPLLLEEFQWTNEWVDKDIAQVHGGDDDLSWAHVDEAIGASRSLRGRNVPRRARGDVICYSRRQDSSSTSNTHEEDSDNEEEDVCDDEEIEDDFGQQPSTEQMDEGNDNDDEHLDVFMLDDE